jgi:hypothetical protein
LSAILACNGLNLRPSSSTASPPAALNRTPTPFAGATTNPTSGPAPLLNEILFHPVEAQPQFVELKGIGPATPVDGLALVNEAGGRLELPAGLQLKAGEVLLVLFDSQNKVEGNTVHANLSNFLNPTAGVVQLAANGVVLDEVAWGADQIGAVRLSRGGKIPAFVPGTTIGRFPLSTGADPLEWVTFAPDQATPGAANPQPGVEALLPLSGALLRPLSVNLSWYPVAGAAQYRVQVASDSSFAAPLVDQTVPQPRLSPTGLAPGRYFWRVQALASDGSAAAFSPANSFTIQGASPAVHLASPRADKTLGVPYIQQHKDTPMLLLESPNPSGPHAWDVDHKVLDENDPADNMNCSLASIAMVTAFFGGHLSQDRIGYEVFKGRRPGPEMDLNFQGLMDDEITQALRFALGAAPVNRGAPGTPDDLWKDVQQEIDAGRPIVATNPHHVFVITGYHQDQNGRYVSVNDPWDGQYDVDITGPIGQDRWDTYWLLPHDPKPASDEPELSQDSDEDGVLDFDEVQRFHTDPNNQDTDTDKVPDKTEIYASVYDPKHGYAVYSVARADRSGRDFDHDNVPMELDLDSDGGGCFDGMEDTNYDGKYGQAQGETYNFDPKDDPCILGRIAVVADLHWADGSHHAWTQTSEFSLQPVAGGLLEGRLRVISTEIEDFITDKPGCPPRTSTYSPSTVTWGSDMAGHFRQNSDGSMTIYFRATSPHPPNGTLTTSGGCYGPDPITIPIGLVTGWVAEQTNTLVDGHFDRRDDAPQTDTTGINYQVTHIVQSQNK